jgi:hypothetical protein
MTKGQRGASGPAKSGGGITSNKLVKPGVKAGPPQTNVVSQGAVSRLGSHQVLTKAQPLIPRTASQVPLGNALATNVGAGGPGKGRTVLRAGTQSATPQAIPITGDQTQWPDRKD